MHTEKTNWAILLLIGAAMIEVNLIEGEASQWRTLKPESVKMTGGGA